MLTQTPQYYASNLLVNVFALLHFYPFFGTWSTSFSPTYYITMNNRKSLSLVNHFLKNSPQAQLNLYKQMFKMPTKNAITAVSDKNFLDNFLKSVEVFGTPTSQLGGYRSQNLVNIFRNIRQRKMGSRSFADK